MALKQYFHGSVGPLLYDDSVNDAFETDGEITCEKMNQSSPGTSSGNSVTHGQLDTILAGYQPIGNYAGLEIGSSLPAADASRQGTFFNVRPGAGVDDELWFCIKNTSDNYVWHQLI